MLVLKVLAQYAPARELERIGGAALGYSLRGMLTVLAALALARTLARARVAWRWAGGVAACCCVLAVAAGASLLARSVAVVALGVSGSALVTRRFRGLTAGGGPPLLAIGETRVTRRSVRIPPRHTLVVGATGAGKTVTMRRILAEALATMGAVAVDGKGDPDLERDLERFAGQRGRRFVAWSPYHDTRYSPFGHGSDSEIVDKALAAEQWGDDYYLRLGQRFLGFAVRALRTAGHEPTLHTLARYVDPSNLEALAPEMEAARVGSWNDLAAALPPLERAERQAIAGTQHRLAALAESDVGVLLEPAAGHEIVDLLASVQSGDVVYFNLNADARPALSRMVGAAIVMDLVSIAGTMQRRDEFMPTALMLDDVQAFATDPTLAGVASLFARGRSAGMMVLLGTQSLADLNRARGDGAIEQLLDSCSTLLVHRLPGHGSATRASLELGAREVQRVSEHVEAGLTGWRSRGTALRSRSREPYVRPEELMSLETGIAMLKSTGEPPRRVRVRPTGA